MESRTIELTTAAHKHGNLNIRACGRDFFPSGIYGASTREAGLGQQVMVRPDGLPDPILTDIPTDKSSGQPRWLFRERKWVKQFIRHHNLAPRDTVTIYRVDDLTYYVTPAAKISPTHLFENELPPLLYAKNLADQYMQSSRLPHRKERGQYFTPPEIASFMARLATDAKTVPHRILDPGAGTGILSCAICEQLVERLAVKTINVTTYEDEPDLRDLLYKSMLHAQKWASERGARLKFEIHDSDFLTSGQTLFERGNLKHFDVVISNPPYTKISAQDPRAQALSHVVYGQPNLYSLFMAASVPMLKQNGVLVFITPRSYTAGHYFKAFREFFFSQMSPVQVHLFDSRKEVFSAQSVLQESIILKAVKDKPSKNLVVSFSRNGNDIESSRKNHTPLTYALHRDNGHFVLRLPMDAFDDLVIEIVDSWEHRLTDHSLEISTGPVVPFRARQFLHKQHYTGNKVLVPLLWMSNVQPMRTIWPVNRVQSRDSAQQLIESSDITQAAKLLIPNKNIVLLRRFSAKEEKRRLTASPVFKKQFDCEFLGIENHINYIYRPQGFMNPAEVFGLAALLNSALLDRYFRICNGNTQVGAIELRHMPLPPFETIEKLGNQLVHSRKKTEIGYVDKCVWRIARSFTTKKNSFDRLVNCVG